MTDSQDRYVYSLCQMCQNFLEWDKLRLGRLEENTFFNHYSTASDLKISAGKRCHLCLLIYDNLLKSRWPQGEIELPERHIRLTIKYPIVDDRGLYLNASIVPTNISMAGLHEISQVDCRKVTRIITSCFDETIQFWSGQLALEQKLRGTQELVTVEDLSSHRRKYFKGGVDIMAPEFYAIALPFHSCDIHLRTVSPDIDAILTNSMKYDDKSTSSVSAFCMADFWRQICRQKHRHCNLTNKNHDKPPILPKRVLDVGNPSLSGPLLFCPPLGCRAPYLTLSHCWGKKELIRTLRSNISKWITGIPLAEIPQTFLDAFDITYKLGYRYLWIDSLCIIQDSTEDWRDESAKMADIYRNADLCISALDSHDSSEGIYRSRDGLLHRPCRLWDEAPPGLCIPQTPGLPIYAFADPSPPSSLKGPLAHRAWVLQEELMSGRRLIYGKNILYWSCLTTQVSTSEPDDLSGVADTRFTTEYYGWPQYFQEAIGELRGTGVMSRSYMENLYQCWLLIIENYSRRVLSRGSDKLTALAGVASEFGRVTQDSYLSGLWSRFLWRQLLWSVASKGAPPFNREISPESIEPRLVPDFLGPTWSWSRIDGHIRYFHQYPLDKMDDHEVLVEILCSRCSPSSPKEISNNYSGVLSLRGFLAKAIAKPFSPGSKRIVMHNSHFDNLEPTKEQLVQHQSKLDMLAKKIQTYPGDASYARPLGETVSVDSFDLPQLPWSIDSSHYSSGFDNEIHSPGFSLIPRRDFPVIQNLREPIYPGHPVINFDGEQVGLWAPDLPSARETVEIICLAVSSNSQFVFCIGMELVNGYQNRYQRVGLIFWEKSAWATAAAETDKSLIELE